MEKMSVLEIHAQDNLSNNLLEAIFEALCKTYF